ncbi:MAG: single-strand DNA-binding protein [Herbaspirillum sp.]|nr:single-strand DNA-binding protein [Herbaspirillum sp.]
MAQIFGLARIGRDAEIRYTQAGLPVCNLALAFSYGRKDDSGKRPTQWVEGVLWDKRAEALAPYLLKGGAVSVTISDVHIETYQSAKGQGTKLIGNVSEIELAGSPASAQQPQQQRPATPAPRQGATPARPASAHPDMDDEVPFN